MRPDADREIMITRLLDAPRELVWKAWTDPQQVIQWWGPDGFTTTTQEMDLRPGGLWRFVMHGPDGTDYENRIEFTEVEEGRLLAYRQSGEGAHAHIHFVSTITLEEEGQGTRLTLRTVFPTAEAKRANVETYDSVEGGLQHVGRLVEHLSGSTGVQRHRLTFALPSEKVGLCRRVIDAPRDLVFEAFTKAEHLERWWGSKAYSVPVCEIDFRPGGAWRIEQQAPNGQVHPFRGVYREIVRPERIVWTFIYDVEPFNQFEAVETMTFEEQDGRTILTSIMEHATQEARDGHFENGMEAGAAESMDRLEELVAELAETVGAQS